MKLGFVISAAVAGLIWLSVLQVSNSIYTHTGSSSIRENVKIRAEALADVIEHDLNRIGFGVSGNGISVADSNWITFTADFHNDGILREVTWYVTVLHQNERIAIRMIDSVQVEYFAGIQDFRFNFRNKLFQQTNSATEIAHIDMMILSSQTGFNQKAERHAIIKTISPRNVHIAGGF
jgi:hypothetical protein